MPGIGYVGIQRTLRTRVGNRAVAAANLGLRTGLAGPPIAVFGRYQHDLLSTVDTILAEPDGKVIPGTSDALS